MKVKYPVLFSAALTALSAFSAIEAVNVKLRQDWPWSNAVTLTYDLSGVSEETPGEVVVQALKGGEPVAMSAEGLSGDIYNLTENGTRTIRIDPVRAFGGDVEVLPGFSVSLTARAATAASTNVLYKIFDLTACTVTNVTRGALLNGEWGTVETDYGKIGPGYATTLDDVVIWTGVTNDVAYKTTKLVLRKIPAGDFKGYAPGAAVPAENNMTWTFDYWIGVFEVTQKQRSLIGRGSWNKTSVFIGETLPDQYVQNYYLYGAQQRRDATTNNVTDTTGFFQKLRNKFKLGDVCPYDFELPTQTQWVRAMRAGADAFYYDGLPAPADPASNDGYAALANYRYNGGLVENADGSVTTNIVEVGRFRPNAYGLYDMLGNVREHVRESGDVNNVLSKLWNTAAGTNVVGTTGASNHSATFGGSFRETGAGGKSGFGSYAVQTHSASGGSVDAGFRVCMQSMADGIALFDLFNR